MKYPRVKSVSAIDEHNLLVEFDNNEKKTYDISPLLRKEIFSPLRNPSLFKAVKVEHGGYAVSWNDEIDISEYELWMHGQPVP